MITHPLLDSSHPASIPCSHNGYPAIRFQSKQLHSKPGPGHAFGETQTPTSGLGSFFCNVWLHIEEEMGERGERGEVCRRGSPGRCCCILFCSCTLSSSLLPLCPRHTPLKSLPPSLLPQFPHLLPHGLGIQSGQGELQTGIMGKAERGLLGA